LRILGVELQNKISHSLLKTRWNIVKVNNSKNPTDIR